MSGLKWCSWCCKCQPRQFFCCKCCLCRCCCRCPPPCLPGISPMPELPCMPCMGPPPPPIRIVKEHVVLPVPIPYLCLPKCVPTCMPTCGGDNSCSPCFPPACCYEPDPEVMIYHPCPPAFPKRIFRPGCPILPGYTGHVPGLKMHGAGRTHGAATKDTCCIISQWGNCCPRLPRRIFEQ